MRIEDIIDAVRKDRIRITDHADEEAQRRTFPDSEQMKIRQTGSVLNIWRDVFTSTVILFLCLIFFTVIRRLKVPRSGRKIR